MFIAWVVFHVIVCVALVLVVLLQSSKGEGLAGSAFGGGGGLSGAVFGGRGAATFLSKATSVLAVVFMLNCGGLAFLSADRQGVSTDPTQTTDSPVTQQAQREMEEAMARQQQQQQLAQPVDSTGAPVEGVDLLQQEAPAETPAEEGSGN